MKYKIKVWNWNFLIFDQEFTFTSPEKAEMFARGVYFGVIDCKEATGYTCKPSTE